MQYFVHIFVPILETKHSFNFSSLKLYYSKQYRINFIEVFTSPLWKLPIYNCHKLALQMTTWFVPTNVATYLVINIEAMQSLFFSILTRSLNWWKSTTNLDRTYSDLQQFYPSNRSCQLNTMGGGLETLTN